MTNDLEDVERLKQLRDTPELLEEISASSGSDRGVQKRLRARYDAALVRAGLGLLESRQKAQRLLPGASELWLTRVGLEQATAWAVAEHKARRFPEGADVSDLCSGIGVDTAALLRRGPVTSVDLDPTMTLRSRWNIDAWRAHGSLPTDHALQQHTADVHSLDLQGQLLHCDPDRRGDLDRPVKRLEQYCPNLEWMQRTIGIAAGGALKLGPASNFMQKFPGCEIELVSLNGECREATVWFGDLAGEHSFRATSLPTGESISADPLSAYCPQATAVSDFILDPDPALVRSGLLDVFGEMSNLQRLDKGDEYLTAAKIPNSAFATAFQVEATLGNNPRELKRYLRSHPGRDYEIKCRHIKVDANALQRKLPRGDGPIRVLFFVRLAGKAQVVVAQRIQNSAISQQTPVDN